MVELFLLSLYLSSVGYYSHAILKTYETQSSDSMFGSPSSSSSPSASLSNIKSSWMPIGIGISLYVVCHEGFK